MVYFLVICMLPGRKIHIETCTVPTQVEALKRGVESEREEKDRELGRGRGDLEEESDFKPAYF